MIVELFDIDDADRMAKAFAIRMRVFVEEQSVPPDEEIDAHDRTDREAVHAIVRDDAGSPMGAGRYYVAEPGIVQIGRMAVLAEARKRGYGEALLEALIAEAARRGFTSAHLHAQVHARGFYVKNGFVDDGPELWDAGILHQPMSRRLIRPESSESPEISEVG